MKILFGKRVEGKETLEPFIKERKSERKGIILNTQLIGYDYRNIPELVKYLRKELEVKLEENEYSFAHTSTGFLVDRPDVFKINLDAREQIVMDHSLLDLSDSALCDVTSFWQKESKKPYLYRKFKIPKHQRIIEQIPIVDVIGNVRYEVSDRNNNPAKLVEILNSLNYGAEVITEAELREHSEVELQNKLDSILRASQRASSRAGLAAAFSGLELIRD